MQVNQSRLRRLCPLEDRVEAVLEQYAGEDMYIWDFKDYINEFSLVGTGCFLFVEGLNWDRCICSRDCIHGTRPVLHPYTRRVQLGA